MPRSGRRGEWPIHSLIKWSGTAAFRSTAKTKTPEHVESATLPCSVQPIEYIALVKQPTVHSCKQVSIQSGRVLAQTCANGSGISMSRFALAVFGCCCACVPNASPDMKYPAARFEVVGIGYLPGFGAKYIETEIALSRPKSASPCF